MNILIKRLQIKIATLKFWCCDQKTKLCNVNFVNNHYMLLDTVIWRTETSSFPCNFCTNLFDLHKNLQFVKKNISAHSYYYIKNFELWLNKKALEITWMVVSPRWFLLWIARFCLFRRFREFIFELLLHFRKHAFRSLGFAWKRIWPSTTSPTWVRRSRWGIRSWIRWPRGRIWSWWRRRSRRRVRRTAPSPCNF